MPVTVRWDTESNDVVCLDLSGKWGMDDLGRAWQRILDMYAPITRPVVVLINLQRAVSASAASLISLHWLCDTLVHNQAQHVIVGADRKSVRLLLTRSHNVWVSEQPYQFAATLEEARRLLLAYPHTR